MPVLQDYTMPSVVVPTTQLNVQIDLSYDFSENDPLQVMAHRLSTGDVVLVQNGVNGQTVTIDYALGHVDTTNPFYGLDPVEQIEFRVSRAVTPLQEWGGTNNDTVDIRDIVASLDRLTKVQQQLYESFYWYRGAEEAYPDPITFYRPVISPDPLVLPGEGGRESRLLGFNADGDTRMVDYTEYILTLLDDPDAATARATLGAASQAQVDGLAADLLALDGRVGDLETLWTAVDADLAALWAEWGTFIDETWPGHTATTDLYGDLIGLLLQGLQTAQQDISLQGSWWLDFGYVLADPFGPIGGRNWPTLLDEFDADVAALASHESDTANPHAVTAAQVGTMTTAEINAAIAAGGGGATLGDILAALDAAASPYAVTMNDDPWVFPRVRNAADGDWEAYWRTAADFRSDIGAASASDLTAHESDTANPHSVTAAQVGAYSLAEVDGLLAGLSFQPLNSTLSKIANGSAPDGTFTKPGLLGYAADAISPADFAYYTLGDLFVKQKIWDNENATRSLFFSPFSNQVGLQFGISLMGKIANGYAPIAIGRDSLADATYALALGASADAGHASSTALGYGATTTAANQVMIGGASDAVEIPGTLGDLACASIEAQTATWVMRVAREMQTVDGLQAFIRTYSGLGTIASSAPNWGTVYADLDVRPGEVIDQIGVQTSAADYPGYAGDIWDVALKSAVVTGTVTTVTTHETVSVSSPASGQQMLSAALITPVTVQAGRRYWVEPKINSAYYGPSYTLSMTAAGARVQGRFL